MRALPAGVELDEVGVAADPLDLPVALGGAEDGRLLERLAGLELLPDVGRVVDAEDDQIARPAPVEGSTRRGHLVQDDLDAPDPRALADGVLDALEHAVGDLAPLAAPGVAVLANDD